MTQTPLFSGEFPEKLSAGQLAKPNPSALSLDVSDYLRASLSDNSRRAYRADLAHFLAWGGTIPANPETVAIYLAAYAG